MTTRTRYTATYDYPGALFPESIVKRITDDELATVLAAAPTETEGTYFVKDGWYAVTVHEILEKRYVADDGEETWVKLKTDRVARMVVGEKIHVDDLPRDDQYEILRSNIKANTEDGFAVKTRAGNWQFYSDYDLVLSLAEASA